MNTAGRLVILVSLMSIFCGTSVESQFNDRQKRFGPDVLLRWAPRPESSNEAHDLNGQKRHYRHYDERWSRRRRMTVKIDYWIGILILTRFCTVQLPMWRDMSDKGHETILRAILKQQACLVQMLEFFETNIRYAGNPYCNQYLPMLHKSLLMNRSASYIHVPVEKCSFQEHGKGEYV